MKKLLLIAVLLFTLSFNQVNAADTVTGIDDGYEGTDVTIESNEDYTLYIDNVLYESGDEYSVIGHHVLTVYDGEVLLETLSFTIIPDFGYRISRDGERVFYDVLELEVKNEGSYSAMVNGKKTSELTEFTEVGYYSVIVFGANGYSKSYQFTLLNSDIDLLDTTIIDEAFDIDCDVYQEVYINDVLREGNISLDLYGFYKVELVGLEGYTYSLYFAYITNDDDYSDQTVRRFEIETDTAVSVILDGELVEEDMILKEVGYHTIIVNGVEGYSKEFNITIKEATILIDDYEELEKFKVGDVGGTLYLNGEKYTPDTEISAIGDYTFVVKGVNGYEKTIHFQIRHDYPIENYENYDEPINLNIDIDKIYVNGKLVKFDYRIGKTGTYEIELKGAGGFTETFNISYRNHNDQFIPVLNIVAFSLAGIVFTIYGIIFWRRSK